MDLDPAPPPTTRQMPAHTVHSLLNHHTHLAAHHHSKPPTPVHDPLPDSPPLVIRNVHLPFESDDPTLADPLYNVYCIGSRVERVELATRNGCRSVSGLSSGRSSPARPPEYHTTGSPRGSASHAELDAQGRGILLPAYVLPSPRAPTAPRRAPLTACFVRTASATRTSTSTSASSSTNATSSSQGESFSPARLRSVSARPRRSSCPSARPSRFRRSAQKLLGGFARHDKG